MISLDSDCIIDFLKGKKEAIEIVEKNKESIVTTEINVFEVFLGIYLKREISEREESSARDFFNSINILPLKKGSGKLAAKILSDLSKKGQLIGQNDCISAAIMLKNQCSQIITHNEKHFSKIKEIKVIGY